MKIIIESDSQEEFDAKRAELIKAIAGDKFVVKAEPKDRATSQTPRMPYYKAQKESLKFWNSKYEAAIEDIKAQIDEIIK